MSASSVSGSFRNRADSAAFYEAWVGMVLSRAGLYTLHHPFTVAENSADIASYAHTWDLDVMADPELESSVPCEVKSVNLPFTGAADYPYTDVLVCSQKSWENKWPGEVKTQRDFLFVSRLTGAILWLPVGSEVSLGHKVHDSSRNETYLSVKTSASRLEDCIAFCEYVHG